MERETERLCATTGASLEICPAVNGLYELRIYIVLTYDTGLIDWMLVGREIDNFPLY